MAKKELDNLILLLDDPDHEVYEHVCERLLNYGPEVIKDLETAWENNLNPVLQERLETIIHRIQHTETLTLFGRWLHSPQPSLLEGALIVARTQYPLLPFDTYQQSITQFTRDVWLELNQYHTPTQIINIFNQVIYRLKGFKGSTDDILNPSNYFLNQLLETKKSGPLTLGVLYLSVARLLNLPIYGINLPHHFVLCFTKDLLVPQRMMDNDLKNEVVFYINPLNNGAIFGKLEIEEYLKKLNMTPDSQYFCPISDEKVVEVLLRNLKLAYQHQHNHDKVLETNDFLNLMLNKQYL